MIIHLFDGRVNVFAEVVGNHLFPVIVELMVDLVTSGFKGIKESMILGMVRVTG